MSDEGETPNPLAPTGPMFDQKPPIGMNMLEFYTAIVAAVEKVMTKEILQEIMRSKTPEEAAVVAYSRALMGSVMAMTDVVLLNNERIAEQLKLPRSKP